MDCKKLLIVICFITLRAAERERDPEGVRRFKQRYVSTVSYLNHRNPPKPTKRLPQNPRKQFTRDDSQEMKSYNNSGAGQAGPAIEESSFGSYRPPTPPRNSKDKKNGKEKLVDYDPEATDSEFEYDSHSGYENRDQPASSSGTFEGIYFLTNQGSGWISRFLLEGVTEPITVEALKTALQTSLEIYK